MSVEDVVLSLRPYKDGRRPFGKTIYNSLSHRFRIVSRGPNGAVGHGSVLEILPRSFVPRDFGPGFMQVMKERMDVEDKRKDRRNRISSRTRAGTSDSTRRRRRIHVVRSQNMDTNSMSSADITVGQTLRIERGPGLGITWCLFWKSGMVLVLESKTFAEHLVMEVHHSTTAAKRSLLLHQVHGKTIDYGVWQS